MVEFADFNHGPMETPMTETTLPLIELLQKQERGTHPGAVAAAMVLGVEAPHDSEQRAVRGVEHAEVAAMHREFYDFMNAPTTRHAASFQKWENDARKM